MNPIIITKGDSTNFADDKLINVVVTSDVYNVTNWSVQMIISCVKKVGIYNQDTGSFNIYYTSDETKKFRLGGQKARLQLLDDVGNVRTAALLPVLVTDGIMVDTSETVTINIPSVTETEITIDVGKVTDYNYLLNKPQINNVTLEGNVTLQQIGSASINDIPTNVSQLNNDSGYITKSVNNLENYTNNDDLDILLENKVDTVVGMGLSTNDFTNAFKTKLEGIQAGAQVNTVNSVNGKIGDVSLTANDVGALPSTYTIPVATTTRLGGVKVDGTTITISNDGTITSVGSGQETGVTSVNGKTGTVTLTASDVGALPNTTVIPTQTSQLTNNSGYITNTVNNLLNYTTNEELDNILAGKANTSAIPTNISELFNDTGYITNTVNDLINYTDTQTLNGLLDNKANNEVVTTLSSTQELQTNTIYRGGTMASVSLTLPNTIVDDFICEVDFTSGTTATALTTPDSIKWSGDDLTDDVFVPVASKRYNVLFYYDGVNMNGIVRGIA